MITEETEWPGYVSFDNNKKIWYGTVAFLKITESRWFDLPPHGVIITKFLIELPFCKVQRFKY